MKSKLLNLVFVPVTFFLASCMSMGVNFKHKTPKKASRLPAFTVKDSLIGFNSQPRACFDVKHYDIALKLDIPAKSIRGAVTTRFELVAPSPSIQLDLDEQMQVDSIKQGDQHLKFSRKYTAIFIDLASPAQQQLLTVYYHGKPVIARKPPWAGGFVWKEDKNKKAFVSVACEGNGAKAWLPVKTYLGDEPDSVSMHLTVPKELVAVSNGKLVSAQDEGSEKTWSWKTSYQVNPYNITFYVGDYRSFEEEYTCLDGEKMTMRFYVLPENLEKAKGHFAQARTILSTFEKLFGKYPWPKDGYKLVESPYEGMEHQTAIAYGNGYKNQKGNNFDYIILHESAHEWWGNAVSVADFADVWIHEGFATYAEALYVEQTQGHQAYLDYMSFVQLFVMNKKPVIGPTGLYYWNYNDSDPYGKGAAMLHALRNQLNNDTLFFSIIRNFYKGCCYRITTTKEFVELVNKLSGRDLTLFFDQYLYHRASPQLLWNFDYDPALQKDQLVFQLGRVNPGFSVLLEVMQGEDKFYITPTNEVQFYTLPHPASVPVYMNTQRTYLQNGYKELPKVKSK